MWFSVFSHSPSHFSYFYPCLFTCYRSLNFYYGSNRYRTSSCIRDGFRGGYKRILSGISTDYFGILCYPISCTSFLKTLYKGPGLAQNAYIITFTLPPFFNRRERRAPPIPFIFCVFRGRRGEKEFGRDVQLNTSLISIRLFGRKLLDRKE